MECKTIHSDPNVDIHIFYGTGLDTPCAFDYTNRRFPDYSPVESKYYNYNVMVSLEIITICQRLNRDKS